MPGLLDALDGLFSGSGISVSVDAQLGPLGNVTGSVQALIDGPTELSDLEGVLEGIGLPPGLSALTGLPALIEGIAGGVDVEGALGLLAPILEPLAGIAGEGFDLGGVLNITAAVDCFRLIIDLASGQAAGGSGFPLPADQWRRQGFITDLEPSEVSDRIAEVEALFDRAGPALDGDAVVALLRRVAPYWRTQMNEWPQIPVLSDVMEIAGVAVEWSDLDGPALTAHLDGRLRVLADVVALPRTKVAAPLVAQCETAARLPEVLASAAAELAPLLTGLRRKVTQTFAKPTATELRLVEAHVLALEQAAAAVSLDGTPLDDLERLVRDLELHRLRSVRAVLPPYGNLGLTGVVNDLLARIPDADPDPLADAVTAVEQLDLSFLTGPIAAVRQAVEDAVTEVEGAFDTVRTELTGLIQPAADALDQLLVDAGIADLQAELAGLPATIQGVVDDEIMPALEPITSAVETAVQAMSDAADAFNPDELIAPLREAVEDLADLVGTDEVGSVVAEVQQAIQSAVDVLGTLNFASAADAAIAELEAIEAKLAEIDLSGIPDALQQPLKQAVEVVASIDFTGEVGEPLTAAATAALAAGPQAVLNGLQNAMTELRVSLERFKPSIVVGEALDEPFDAALGQLERFEPSDVLDLVNEALRSLADQVSVLDPEPLIAPLVRVYAELETAVESARPSNLLRPVEEAIEAAIARVFEVTGVDDVFDGIDDVMSTITGLLDVAQEAGRALAKVGEFLASPGDPGGALEALADDLADRLDPVDLAALRPRFDDLAAAGAAVLPAALAAELVTALRAAQRAVPPALTAPAVEFAEQVRAFPLATLLASPPAPRRRRLADLVARLRAVADVLEAAPEPWDRVAAEIDARAPRLQADLGTYQRLAIVDGRDVFADCLVAPASVAELKAKVRDAAREGLELPVAALFGLFAKLAPHVAGVATGLAAIVAATHAKLDAITGTEGIGGVAEGLDAAADLLRDLDLTPLTDPLDALYGRVETAVGLLDPEPLAAALRAAAAAIAGLLDISTLVDDGTVATLDAAYAAAIAKLRALSPSAVVAATLDPEYEELLGNIVPLLDLPGRLSELLGSVGANLGTDLVVQLGRVEAAFDAMLRAIPFNGGPAGVSVSVSASVSVGGA